MPRHPLTVEDLWKLPRVGSPAPSPDGTRLIVPVTTYSMEANEGITRLWLVPADAREAGQGKRGDSARPLTGDDASCSEPAWSPDGTRLVYVRRPRGVKAGAGPKPGESPPSGPRYPAQPQLYLLTLTGGEPERLTDLPFGVCDPRWFPDGRRLAFVAPMYGDARGIEQTAAFARQREEEPVKAMVTEDRLYRYWDRWLTDRKVHHLFALDLETRELMDLMPDSQRWFELMDPAGQYRLAPDGLEIAFSACRTKPPHDPALYGVFTVRVPRKISSKASPSKVRELTPKYASDAIRPVYSPDGRWIIFGLQREVDFYADKVRLVAHERKTGKQTVLTEDWDYSADHWTFGDESRHLYILAEEEARTGFFSLDLAAALKDPKAHPPRALARGGTLTEPRPAGERIFTSMSTLKQPAEIWACRSDGKQLRQVTAFTRPVMENVEISEVEEMHFPGAEGRSVQMYVVYPPGERRPKRAASKRGRWPLVHMIHGGPHGAFHDEWHGRWNAQAFAAPGYLVALVNFHGSTGWGQEFCASILGRWGDQPYRDVMAATEHLIELGLADPKRMAATGGSYGGYLVAWIAAQTDRFACLINHAGVADFQTQYASDWTQGRARAMGGEPWDRIEGMDRWNPMRHASGFRSPMLVIHGEKDYRVPYDQGIGMYNVYKAMKLPARLVVYPDENHWILKPRNSRHWYGEVLGWLDRWLGKRGASTRAR